jgi:ABC-type bacteriocin/lantibiotic exporter with double-glycine peptidase domain
MFSHQKVLPVVILIPISLILLSCAIGPPVKNSSISKSNLPQKYSIPKVPLYRQTYMDCGPTSLRMVLNFYWKNYSQEEIVKARRGRGTAVSDVESFARSQGFEVYSYYDSKKEEMKYLLVQDYPLIAIGVPPPNWPKRSRYSGEGHYVVVVGYDDEKKVFIIQDPAPGARMEVPYEIFKDFHSSHPTHSHFVLCIYPKTK